MGERANERVASVDEGELGEEKRKGEKERRTRTRRWKEVLSSQRDRDDEGRKEEGPSPSPSSSTDAWGRNERCKVIKANVHHLVGDLKARNFL